MTMSGPGIPEGAVYGTIAVDTEDATKVTIKPKSGNETAGLAGNFTFTEVEGVLEDLAGNAIDEVTAVLVVDPPQDRPVYIRESGVCYEDIQAAITGASAGNTIILGLGAFEEPLTINKSLAILGVNADNDPSTEDFIDVGSVVYGGIKITGGDVTLKGLTIKNKGILASGVTRLELSNNKILGIGNAQEDTPAGSIIGLDVASASGLITVDKNVFSSIGVIDGAGTAIRIVKAQDSIRITNNIIRDVTKNGINIYSNCLTQEGAVLTIAHNVIENWDLDRDQAVEGNEGIGGRAVRIEFVGAVSSATASIRENKFVPPIYNGTQTPVDS